MSDNDEGECKATAKEYGHHAEQTPLVLHREGQVLWRGKRHSETPENNVAILLIADICYQVNVF